MAENILQAIITADGRDFTKTITDLERQYKRFQEGLKSASGVDSVARINKALEATKQRIDALKSFSGTSQLESGFQRIATSSNAANIALINTGRVFQDLPFGIIGVANNINPLIESFQRLKIEAAETGTSISSKLVQSLIGGGGLGLAFSVITGALSFLAVGFSAFTRGMGGSSDQAKELKTDIQALGDSFQNMITQLKETRNILSSIDWESAIINVKNFGHSGDAALRILELRLSRNKDAAQFVATTLNQLKQSFDALTTDPKRTSGTSKERQDIEDAIAKNIEARQKGIKEEQDVLTEGQVIQEQINLQKLQNQKDVNDKSLQATKDFIQRAKELFERFPTLGGGKNFIQPIDPLLDSLSEQLTKAKRIINEFNDTIAAGGRRKLKLFAEIDVNEETKQIEDGIKKIGNKLATDDFKNSIPSIKVDLIPDPDSKKREGLLDEIRKQAESLAATTAQIFTNAFAAFGEGLGNLIAGDSVKSFFSGIFSVIGQGLKQLGTQLIITSKLIAGIKKALNAAIVGNPIAGIALGVALVAAGAAMQKSIQFRERGGPVNAGQTYIVGERGPEIFVPNRSGTIVPNSQIGGVAGGMKIEIFGRFEQSGNDMVAVISKVNRSQGRG